MHMCTSNMSFLRLRPGYCRHSVPTNFGAKTSISISSFLFVFLANQSKGLGESQDPNMLGCVSFTFPAEELTCPGTTGNEDRGFRWLLSCQEKRNSWCVIYLIVQINVITILHFQSG